jgi:hypothetical protein
LRISRRERAAPECAKIATISRAKRSDCMRVLDGRWLHIYGCLDIVVIMGTMIVEMHSA